MRFVDLAVASIIGLSSISVIALWGPGALDSGAARYVRQTWLTDDLTRVISEKGFYWFQFAALTSFCSMLSSLSNETVTYSGSINGMACAPHPQRGAISANVTMTFEERTVALEAW